MYIGIDVGGTKTLVALMDEDGVITQQVKFPSPQDYRQWLKELETTLTQFDLSQTKAAAIGVPTIVNFESGTIKEFANLAWANVSIKADVEAILGLPVLVDNDANLAGLSEAMLVKDQYQKVIYVTVSTGIGGGVIINQHIDRNNANFEPGHMVLEHDGELVQWESFGAGSSITKKYGMMAKDITDEAVWQDIAENIGLGMQVICATLQPEVIVIGGSIGTHYAHYGRFLTNFLDHLASPQVPVPPIVGAQRPELAVVYGCYDLAKQHIAEA